MRLLLVDDSSEIRDSLRKTLSSISNIEIVGEAANVDTAKELIISLKPQIVILDFQLAGGTALDVLKSFADNENRPVFIIFSNFSANQYVKACLDAGANYFFNKSANLTEFITCLVKLTSSK